MVAGSAQATNVASARLARQGVCHRLKDSFVFLQVSLAAANDKLAQLDRRARNATTVNLGVPILTGNC
jgi:hypothetical protein